MFLLKSHFLYRSLIVKSQLKRIELVTRQVFHQEPSNVIMGGKAVKVKSEGGGGADNGEGPGKLPLPEDLKPLPGNKCPKCTREFQYAKGLAKHIPKCDGVLRQNKSYVPKKPWEKIDKRKEKAARGEEVCPVCMKDWKSYLKPLEHHIKIHR